MSLNWIGFYKIRYMKEFDFMLFQNIYLILLFCFKSNFPSLTVETYYQTNN